MKLPFAVPAGRILPVDSVRIALSNHPHAFETENAAAIADNWEAERVRNPALFDGEVVLLSALRLDGADLVGVANVVRFRTFMYWRTLRPPPHARNVFAHAMPVSADGALIAIRMAPRTVNAGRIYFAAGTVEPQDFRDGQVDLEHNMAREVMEETGLDIAVLRRDPAYVLFASDTGTVLARRYYLDFTADEAVARIERFVRHEAEPEITGPVVIRSPRDRPDSLMPHMPPLIDWHFAHPPHT